MKPKPVSESLHERRGRGLSLALLVISLPCLPLHAGNEEQPCPKCEAGTIDPSKGAGQSLDTVLADIERERAAIAREREATEQLARTVLEALARLDSKKAVPPKDTEAKSASLREELRAAEATRSEALKQAAEAREASNSLELQCREMRRAQEKTGGELASLRREHAALSAESEEARAVLAAREEELNALRNLEKAWDSQRAALEKESENLRRKFAECEETSNKARAALVSETIKSKKLEAELGRLKARPSAPPEIAPVRFSKNIDLAEAENARVLRDVRAVLADFPDARFHLSGHTSSESTSSLNLGLSIRRARNLAEHLVAKGIPRERITYEGQGESSPVADNNTEEGRSLNRRVEIWVTD